MRWLLCCAILIGAMSATAKAETFADSELDWSFDGVQGENNWFNGYYNLTLDQLDGDGIYQMDDFIPFQNLEGPAGGPVEPDDNNWTGTQWDLADANSANPNAPWTLITPTGGHPNGVNSFPNDEHWAIRRWVSDRAGDVALLPTLASGNGAGPGTSVELYLNGTRLDVIQGDFVDGSFVAASQYVPKLTTNLQQNLTGIVGATLAIGDVIDIALTPEGVGGDRNDGSDATNFWLRVTDDAVPDPLEPPPMPLASSSGDWSSTGTQGENNWYNGYYNLTLDQIDSDGVYQVEDFTPFDNLDGPAGGPVEPDGNHWNGTGWDLADGNSVNGPAPWTAVGVLDTHPNGTNSAPNDEHWTIRRWVANDLTDTTPLELNWKMAKTNLNGTGVTGKLLVNGEEVDSFTIAGNDGVGVDRKFYVNANPGDIVDLALTPLGIGDDADGSDGSQNELIIRDELPDGPLFNPGPTVADSLAEFSGTQGQDNWFYGFYNQLRDVEEGDGEYGVDDFEAFLNDGSDFIWDDAPTWEESENHWSGTKWDLVDNGVTGTGPWTEVTAAGGHPAANAQGDPEVQWSIRRWVSDVDGDFQITGTLSNGGAGDGVVGRILLDGEEIWSEVSDGNAESVLVDVNIAVGSILDFVIDADGGGNFDPSDPLTIANVLDGSDGTTFSVRIGQILPFTPVGGKRGDYNGNGILDSGDLDLQAQAMKDNDLAFDENGDGVTNLADRVLWVQDLKNTWVGDSNLDGKFGSGDLVDVFQSGKYELDEMATWAEGDWDGDMRFGSGDLVLAFTEGGYEMGEKPGGPNAAVAAVPEPSSLMLLVLASLGIVASRRRRS